MSNANVMNLLNEGKIDQWAYDTYILFEGNELGRSYLKNTMEAILLEPSPGSKGTDYAFQDGRRSSWRDIRTAINVIKNILQGVTYNDDRRDSPNEQYPGQFDFSDATPFGNRS